MNSYTTQLYISAEHMFMLGKKKGFGTSNL